MSGGSYEYLYLANGTDLFAKVDMLEAMLERLRELEYAFGPMRATEWLLAEVKFREDRLNEHVARLAAVWRAVELWDSGDVSEDAVRLAVQNYMAALPLPQGMNSSENTEA